jgi:hypothetical protein
MQHPGFKKVAQQIASKEGISKEAESAILASHTRAASKKAKQINPKLKNVK